MAKKFISLMLCAVMVLGLCTFAAGAETDGDYNYSVSDGEAIITVYTGSGGDVVIPSTLGGYSVTEIGEYAFENCTSLTSVFIPETVTWIGSYSFSGCTNLTSMFLFNGVNFADDPFGIWPENITVYFHGSFDDWESIANHVEYFDEYDEFGNLIGSFPAEVLRFDLPADVASEVYYADGFVYDCDEYNDEIRIMGCMCDSLQNVVIPSTLDGHIVSTIINFGNCPRLTSITIPESVTDINQIFSPFSGCPNLSYIEVSPGNPNYYSVNNCIISQYGSLICGCRNSVIPDDGSVTNIGSAAFSGCTSLTSVTIPDSVTSIVSDAFSGCTSLTSITIPDSVTSIGEHAFDNCTSLTSVEIGSGVTSIEECAFNFCNNLSTVYYSGTEEEWNQISIHYGNDRIISAEKVFNSVGTVTSTDNVELYAKSEADGAVPARTGKRFAGWYTALGDVFQESSGAAVAKYVDEKVMSVKVQASLTNDGSLRFLSTVDCLDYLEAGFYISVDAIKWSTKKTLNKVYTSVYAAGQTRSPEAVGCAASNYITFMKLTGIPSAHYNSEIVVTPYWITADGTEITGISRTLTYNSVFQAA